MIGRCKIVTYRIAIIFIGHTYYFNIKLNNDIMLPTEQIHIHILKNHIPNTLVALG